MTGWIELQRELDAWTTTHRRATFWWRDDDASEPTPALERLLALHRRTGVPLILAVIPGRARPELALRLRSEPGVEIAQHGWLHLNHAPPRAPKAELGPHRPPAYILGELARGAIALDRIFSRGWLRVMVPPHNRIAPAVARSLALAGYVGLSAYGPRGAAIAGLVQVNTHVDIMDWTARAFGGPAAALGLVTAHLAARRAGTVDAEEPTGLLTHHLAHDEAAWAFVEEFQTRLARHPAAEWRVPGELFGPSRLDRR